MYRMKVNYTDYNGNERSEEFYFNLNKAELAEMAVSEEGGLDKVMVHIAKTGDKKELIRIMKMMVLKAYGEKSLDGKSFRKSDALRAEFENSAAYPEIFMALANDDKKAAEFFNNIIPQVSEADRRKALEELDIGDDIAKQILLEQ